MNKSNIKPNEGSRYVDAFCDAYETYLSESNKANFEMVMLAYIEMTDFMKDHPIPSNLYHLTPTMIVYVCQFGQGHQFGCIEAAEEAMHNVYSIINLKDE